MHGREKLEVWSSCELHIKRGFDSEYKAGFVYLKTEADSVMDAMETRIKELEEAISKMETTQKWISVKDRFPCEDGEYQVVYKHKNGALEASFDEWDNDCHDWMNATDRVAVVFWAELLPTPPTTEENK